MSGSNQYTDLKPLLLEKETGWFVAPGGTQESAPLTAELISSKALDLFTGIQSVDDQVFRSSEYGAVVHVETIQFEILEIQ